MVKVIGQVVSSGESDWSNCLVVKVIGQVVSSGESDRSSCFKWCR